MSPKILLLFLLMIGFVSALDVDLDCPDEVYAGEEFVCDVSVSDGDAKYDLKVEVDEERDSVLEIWNGDDWQSGYYYLKGFVEDDKKVRLRIEKKGNYDVVVKLRDGEFREEFDGGDVRVLEAKEEDLKREKFVKENGSQVDADLDSGVISFDTGEARVISFGDEVAVDDDGGDEDGWDYVSKDGMVVDWLPYVFCLFLIGLVGVLVWDRRN